jgi:peptidoglycan/LPS O-acetylase OafA/YrhL
METGVTETQVRVRGGRRVTVGSVGRLNETRWPTRGRIKELDGLRAVAIGLVVAFHFDMYLPGGFVGVDLFFAISGFVITRQVLANLDGSGDVGTGGPRSGSSILIDFYRRRAWRLVPGLVVTIAVVVMTVMAFPSHDVGHTATNAVASLSGFANWWVGSTATQHGVGALAHTWSLSVEEQFYLLFPVALVLGRRFAERIAVVMSAGLIMLSALSFASMTFSVDGINHTYFSSIARSTPIALGVALAVFSRRQVRPAPAHALQRGPQQSQSLGSPVQRVAERPAVVALAILGALMVPMLLRTYWNDRWLYRGGFLVIAVVLAAIVALTVEISETGNPMARLLRSRVALWIGDRSYAMYLTHYPIAFRFGSYGRVGALVLRIVATLIATELLHRLVEKPLRHQGPRFKNASLLVGLQAAVAIASIGFLVFRSG